MNMRKKNTAAWINSGLKWYMYNVLGGIFSFGRFTGWLLHDFYFMLKQIDNEEVYYIGKSVTKLCLAIMMLFVGIVIIVMNILLIVPISLGIQHVVGKITGTPIKQEARVLAIKDVRHWYDGIIYAAAIDPHLKKIRESVARYISKNSKVIDICCGTGGFVFHIAKQCQDSVGVDHSSVMIRYADKEKAKRELSNVAFLHADAKDLSIFKNCEFDYAVLSFTLHEMPPAIREPVLKEAIRISKEIILIDYMNPMPLNWIGLINLHYEVIGGYDHLCNYLNYRDHGGLDYLLKKVGLSVNEEELLYNKTMRIVKTKKPALEV
jgi:SAM-dependent methyltransferase